MNGSVGGSDAPGRIADVLPLGVCPDCGKWRFETRRKAKRAAKRAHPGHVLRPYRCGSYWHYGHNGWRRWLWR